MSMTGVGNYAEYILTAQYFRETSLFFENYFQQILKTPVSRGVTLLQIKPGRYFLRFVGHGYSLIEHCGCVWGGEGVTSCRLYKYIINVSLDWA